MCFRHLPSFPCRQLGFIWLALKAWMVETTHSISLLNLHKGYPSADSIFQNGTYFCAPQKNVWWNWDTNMKTVSLPLWNQSCLRETAGAVKNKRAPDMRLVESGHQNQTHCLAQRFCWLEPAVLPRTLPSLPPTSVLIPPNTFLLLLSSSLLVCIFLSFNSFLFHTLFAFYSPIPLSSIPPLGNTPHFNSNPSSTHSFVSCWKTTGDEGVGKAFFELQQLLWVMATHLPLSAPLHVNRWF